MVERHASNTAFVIAFLTSLSANSGNLDLNEKEVSEVYRSILSKAMKVIQIRASEIIPPPGSFETLKATSSPQPVLLVKLVKQCDAISIEKADIFEALLNCVRISFTQALWRHFLIPFITGMCEYLGERASASPSSTEKNFITTLISVCLPQYVGAPPQRPTDWKRKFAGTCSCSDCQLLRKFVESPQEKVKYFKLVGTRRTHLASQLDNTFSTNAHWGTTDALKVEKTCKQYEADLFAWKGEVKRIQSGLTSLADKTPLISIIGDDQYKKWLKHKCFQISTESSDTHLCAVRSDSRSNSVRIPKKRSFVDLSEG
jgi:hypothetical protein